MNSEAESWGALLLKNACDMWAIETACFAEGYSVVCGTDEAGRGPLAGPVYAAAVILPKGIEIVGLDDSKKLTEKKREKLYDEIIGRAEAWAVASASVEEIARIDILNAAMLAMRRAVESLGVMPDMLLVDGTVSRGFPCKSRCIPGGDGKSASIAAASILAKVSRDRYMYELAKKYPQYGFEKHKGYGTAQHTAAIREFGPCEEHRELFLRKILQKE